MIQDGFCIKIEYFLKNFSTRDASPQILPIYSHVNAKNIFENLFKLKNLAFNKLNSQKFLENDKNSIFQYFS